MTGWVARFLGPQRGFAFEEHPLPELAEGEVLIALTAATICGSDRWTIEGIRPTPLPITLGHEGVGRVVASRRPGVVIGERVSFGMLTTCGQCDRCEGGLPQKCRSLVKYGHAEGIWSGTYASHLVLHPNTEVCTLPEGLADGPAAPANCAFATAAGLAHQSRGSRVLVVGGGLLGLATAFAVARLNPAAHVEVAERHLGRRAMADELGFAEDSGPVETIIELAGSVAALGEAMPRLRPGGLLLLAGLVHPESALPFSGEDVIRGCWTVQGVHNYDPATLPEAIALADAFARRLPSERWLSPEYALRDLEAALAEAQTGRWLRVLVRPQEASG